MTGSRPAVIWPAGCRPSVVRLAAVLAWFCVASASGTLTGSPVLAASKAAVRPANDLLLMGLPNGEVMVFAKAPLPLLPAVPFPSPAILGFDAREPQPVTPYSDLIYKAARRHAVNPRVVAAVIEAESDFRPKAKSRKGACGLMQLLPETARRFGFRKRDLFNPAKNIEAGVRYLSWLGERFGGDLARTIAAYNAGEGTIDRYGGVPPYSETQGYLRRIYGTLGLSTLLSVVLPPSPERVAPLMPAVPGLTVALPEALAPLQVALPAFTTSALGESEH